MNSTQDILAVNQRNLGTNRQRSKQTVVQFKIRNVDAWQRESLPVQSETGMDQERVVVSSRIDSM